ncbi:ferredoxin [Mycobacterium sp. NS-7484]|uniref:PDR/VanB family oxidoreductase n=1 Tax=Mycobacterium sp. NS-7484 TaxID=1834161 RepID=UPI00096BE35C|nr:PDR/VanB family oxidoreductase [Mycobacterium sp. NS-7484]OMB97516.1 ferredoxin [Mycobacterium sp. NS-7484]
MADPTRRLLKPYTGAPPPGLHRAVRPDLFTRLAGTAVSHFVSVVMRLGGNHELPELGRAVDRRTVSVVGRRSVAPDGSVVELTLAVGDGTPLPAWHPGAHIVVHLPSGRTRHYSLCGDPQRTQEYRIAVRRIPSGGGASVEVHELGVGAVVEISDPRNAFMMPVPGSASRAEKLHFIAGGIGITPILPMIRLAERVGVPWSLRFVGRRRENLPFLDELLACGDPVRVHTTEQHGRVTAGELLDGVDGRTAVYLCGPPSMVDCVRRGLPAGSGTELHVERFSPVPVADGAPFDVELARSARVVRVGANQSTLAALRDALPDVGYSCQQGFCGTCVQRVLAGDVDHRDTLLTDQQRELGQMLVCVSRAGPESGRLVLDL